MTGRRRRPRTGSSLAAQQVGRMLGLVPYISRRPGVTIDELASEFGVDADQITADLNLLMVCGEPGYYPNELIDVVFDDEGGTVSIAYDAGIDRPVRLSPDEAITLTMGLRALGDMPGLIDAEAVHSVLAKLEGAASTSPSAVEVAPAAPAPALGTVREALDSGRRLWIRYYTASRDDVSEREIDPIRVLVMDGHSYVEAYCYSAEAVRRFRVDRIDEVRMLATPSQPPLFSDDATPESLFTPGRDAQSVTLLLTPAAEWVAEYYLMDEIAEVPGESRALRVRLRAPSDDWIVRLVLSLGGAATILDRPDLVEMVRERATAGLNGYGATP